nr:hypothetical protein [uncultured Carboxylicivirga sp.]
MNKKKYRKPIIECFNIDNEISLILMSYEGDTPPPPPPTGGGAAASSFNENNFETTPFEEQ